MYEVFDRGRDVDCVIRQDINLSLVSYFIREHAELWKSQFDENIVNQFKNIFDGISNSKEDDQKWKSRMKDFKDLWNSQETIIQVHPKRDHKKQKRVQCSVKKKKWEEISNLFKVKNIK